MKKPVEYEAEMAETDARLSRNSQSSVRNALATRAALALVGARTKKLIQKDKKEQ